MVRVAIIDDHAVVRMGLKYVIGMDGELEFVGELSGGQGAVEFVKQVKPDVLLLDIYMPGRDGLQVLEDIRLGAPSQKVIMLTTSAADNDVYRALTLGAHGYLMKDRDAADICRAVKTVAAGGKFIPDVVKALLAERQMTPELTFREQGVLNMMVEGNSNDEIAGEMGMSVNGVKQHVKHIFAKLGVSDRVSAVTEAIKRGFVKMGSLCLVIGVWCLVSGSAYAAEEAQRAVITSFGELEARTNVVESVGRRCRLQGVVTHVSALHPRMFIVARSDRPHTTGAIVFQKGEGALPSVGDEVLVDGNAVETPWKLGIEADALALVARRKIGFEYEARFVELRKGLLDYRRVAYRGTVLSVSHETAPDGRGMTILGVRSGKKSVAVHVSGMLDADAYEGREVVVHGVALPMRGENGNVLGHYIEASGENAIAFARTDYAPYVVWSVVPVLSLALVAVFVAWVRSRRERIRMEAVAEERRRMARDLHDTIEQHLACVRILISGVMNMQNLDARVRETLAHSCDVLANAKSEVREAVLNLRGDGIIEQSPADALREIAAGVTKGGAVKVRTSLAALPAELLQGRMQDMVLIVREAITNAIKHGKAKRIVLLAESGDGGATLRILNDGEPFDAAAALGPETGHFGLSGMRERAARSGFTIDFGVFGKWTQVRLQGV